MRDISKPYKPSKAVAVRAALKAEAEARVRAGEARAHVGQDLCLPASTISAWAAIGAWRDQDLARKREGLAPLERPYYARADRAITAGSKPAPSKKAPAPSLTRLEDLTAEAHAFRRDALSALKARDLKAAERHLREARRLTRLHLSLANYAPPEATSA